MKLTKKQLQILADFERLAAPLKIDIDQLSKDTTDRTVELQAIFHQWVRGRVIVLHTLIDEYLSTIIANYFFYKPRVPHHGQLWRTKKFQRFNHYVLDELYLLKKRDLVHAVGPLLPDISSKIMKINDVRNALAHSFYPENRRRHFKAGAALYDGANIFDSPGIEKFLQDAYAVLDALESRARWPER